MKAMNVTEVAYYLVYNYGFEISPCQIPKDDWEYTKLDLYSRLKYKVFWLFKLLMKFAPIKKLIDRPDSSVWLSKRLSDGLCEIELVDPSLIYHNQSSKTNIHLMYSDISIYAQIIDKHEEVIEKLFFRSSVPELRLLVRQKRIESITE